MDYYGRLEKYLFEDLDAVFLEGSRNDSYVYGGYITANKDKAKVDALFNSLHFERIHLTNEYKEGTPEEIRMTVQKEIEKTDQEIAEVDEKEASLMSSNASKLLGAKQRLTELAEYFDIRKKAAIIEDEENKDGHYVICGWMSEADVEQFLKEIKDDDRVMAVVEENKEKFFGEPPTKLKNPKFFKPFEMFIEMYGLPAADEMDPTMFVALTYTLIFGAMFGDLGQHKGEANRQSDVRIKAETVSARQQQNMAVSKAQLELKREYGKRQKELKQELFQEVLKELQEFMKTDEYKELLVAYIEKAARFTNGEDLKIYINPSDADKKEWLEERTGMTLTVSKENFVGGVRAVVKGRNVLIDHAYKGALEEEFQDFMFRGGTGIG